MKNIYDLLGAIGLTVPDDKKSDLDKAVAENYRTIVDYDKQATKLKSAEEQLKTATDGLKAFEGVDVKELQTKVKTLQDDLAAKETEYQTQLADMEFGAKLDAAIGAAKGKNPKAIRALLDVETLKTSKNFDADVKTALETVSKENDYLFDSADGNPQPQMFTTPTNPAPMQGDEKSYLDSIYKNNPFYNQ